MPTTQKHARTCTRDLVFRVQDCGADAADAENQLLAGNATLICTAASAFPSLRDAQVVARGAFQKAIRQFTFSDHSSFAAYCWSEMRSALEDAHIGAQQPVKIPLFPDVNRMAVLRISLADLGLLRRIAHMEDARKTPFPSIPARYGIGLRLSA